MSSSQLAEQLNKMLIVVGPSGVGKGTLINKLLNDFPNSFSNKISHTTRASRAGEINGKNYYFSDKNYFEKVILKSIFKNFK